MARPDAELLAIAGRPLQLPGQAQRIQEQLEGGADIEAQDRHGATALLLVAKSGSAEALWYLLDRGANLNHRDSKGQTALHYATASLGVRPDIRATLLPERRTILKLLLDAGLDPNATADGYDGRTPLWNAAGNLPAEFCETLVTKGADPLLPTTDSSRRVPLDIAVQQGNLETVDFFLDREVRATEAQLAFAVDQNYFKLAARLRVALGQPEPGTSAPLDHLRSLAARLGEEAYSSAEDSGDLDYHEREEDLDPDDLVDDYWQGRFEALLNEAIAVLPNEAQRALPDLDELVQQLHSIYAKSFRDAM